MQISPTSLQTCSVETFMCANGSFKCLHKGNTGKADTLQSWHTQLSLHVQVWLSDLQVFIVLGKADNLVNVHCREKKLAAKAQGRRHASSEDESEDEAGEETEAGSDGEQDPFFQHEDNPFDDPFFRVWPSPLFHLSVLLICLCHCTGEMTAFSIVVQTDVDSAVVTMPVDYKGWSSQ